MDELNGLNEIPKRCISISKKFERAINKYGSMIDIIMLTEGEPESQYDILYGQSEFDVAEDIHMKVLLLINPAEETYKDMHLEVNGDAVMVCMSYTVQDIGLIGNTLNDYLRIPEVLVGNHVKFGNLIYRIDEVKQTDIFMGFPLVAQCALNLYDSGKGGGYGGMSINSYR